MKLFIDIGAPEIFLVLFIPLLYIGLFMLAGYILRWIFKINKFDNVIYPITVFKDTVNYKTIMNMFEERMQATTDELYAIIKNAVCENMEKTELVEYVEKKLYGIRTYFNEKILGHIAFVSYGYAITSHKAQGTTVNNAFIDIFDICQNTNRVEMAKCLYVSIARASNELFILG